MYRESQDLVVGGDMTDAYVVVRAKAARDLIDLARHAADTLTDRIVNPGDEALANALNGAAAEVATDIVEPVGI